jgi:hypothetical protein
MSSPRNEISNDYMEAPLPITKNTIFDESPPTSFRPVVKQEIKQSKVMDKTPGSYLSKILSSM